MLIIFEFLGPKEADTEVLGPPPCDECETDHLDVDEMADILCKFGYSVEPPEEEEEEEPSQGPQVALDLSKTFIWGEKAPRIALDDLAVSIQRIDYNPSQNVITLVPERPLILARVNPLEE